MNASFKLKNTWQRVLEQQLLMALVVLVVFFVGRLWLPDMVAGLAAFIGGALVLSVVRYTQCEQPDNLPAILTGLTVGLALLAILAASVCPCAGILVGLFALVPAAIVVGNILIEKTLSRFHLGLSYLGEALLIGVPIYLAVN